uniref:hypothetical protein n=1 Tax=Eubacterium cellulosolvens TaxID=29322 RepID=UPI00047F5A12|nr:hypothetical protein [[Eubacterium] cellulosolvens]
MGGKVLDYPEKTAYLEGQKDQRKKDEEEIKAVIEKVREKYIRMEMNKGRSKEEAEADAVKLFSVMTTMK